MSTATVPSPPTNRRPRAWIGGLLAGTALAASAWGAGTGVFDGSTVTATPRTAALISNEEWLDPGQRAGGRAALAASASGFARLGGTATTTTTPPRGAASADVAAGVVASSTFTQEQLAANRAGLEAAGLPLTLPGS